MGDRERVERTGLYGAVAYLVFGAVFVTTWIATVTHWTWWVGLLFGWIPALCAALVLAPSWPLLAAGLVVWGIYEWLVLLFGQETVDSHEAWFFWGSIAYVFVVIQLARWKPSRGKPPVIGRVVVAADDWAERFVRSLGASFRRLRAREKEVAPPSTRPKKPPEPQSSSHEVGEWTEPQEPKLALFDPTALKAVVDVGRHLYELGTKDPKVWGEEVTRLLGEQVEPGLQEAWNEIGGILGFKTTGKEFRPKSGL